MKLNDVESLIKRKQKLGSISKVAVLGLPIFLSLSRVFREWVTWLVVPYRALMPIYIFGLLIVFFRYRKTLHEIIVIKLTQDLRGASLVGDEQATVSEIRTRKKRIITLPWIRRNFWLLVGLVVAIAVDGFLWSLAKQMGASTILSAIFAVLAAGVIGIYYWNHETFSKRVKTILDLLSSNPDRF